MFSGLENNFYTGVVEDRNDPLFMGRVRVRIYGLHTDDKLLIPTPDLPWSEVLMPVTAPALSGLGMSPHGLVEGSTVMGIYRDEKDMQDFVVIGSLFGRPSNKWKIPNNDASKAETRDADKGFNDPRRPSRGDYDSSIDKPQNGRNFTLMGSLETAPLGRPKLDQKLDGSGTVVTSKELGERYPRDSYAKNSLSDVNENAVAGSSLNYPNDVILQHEGTTVKELSRTGVSPSYPFNKMIESEAGHVLEMDDTPNAERLHMYHRSGTRLEVLPDGSQTLKVVNDNYEITLKDKKILIGGSADIELVNGNHNLQVYNGDISLTAHKGNINLSTLDSSKATIIKGKVSLNGTAYD